MENDNPLVVIILMCFVVFAVLWIIHSLSGRANRSKKKAETPDCPAYLSVAGRKYKISKTLYGTYSCEGKQFNSLKEATDFIENLWEPDMTGDPLDSDPTVVVKQEPPKLDVNLFDANLPSRTKGTRYMGFGIVLLVLGFSIGATIDGGPGNIIAFLGTMLVVFILIIPGFGLFLRGFRDWRSAAGNRLIKTASLVVICLSVVVMFLWDRYDLGTCLENGANWFAGQMALVVGDINEELNEAAWAGDTAKLVKLTEMGGEFTAPPGDYGITLLMRAIERKDYPMATALINASADVNEQAEEEFNGQTALILAAQQGDHLFVTALVDAGADVNAKGFFGWTALLLAAERGGHEIVVTLIDRGADVNAQTEDGQTALIIASEKGYTEIVDMGLPPLSRTHLKRPIAAAHLLESEPL